MTSTSLGSGHYSPGVSLKSADEEDCDQVSSSHTYEINNNVAIGY